MKRCIISFASTGREDYNKAQRRNINYVKRHCSADLLYYSLDSNILAHNGEVIKSGLPESCPSHKDVPYGFKPYLFLEALNEGYEQVIWLDSTICVMRNLEPMWKHLEKNGVLAFHNIGHNLHKWISDKAVENIGLELTPEVYQIMACVVGFDFTNVQGVEVFREWMNLARDGSSFQNNGSDRPEFIAHRHDQACLSALLWQRDMKLLPYGNLVYEAHENGYEGRTIYFMNKAANND